MNKAQQKATRGFPGGFLSAYFTAKLLV